MSLILSDTQFDRVWDAFCRLRKALASDYPVKATVPMYDLKQELEIVRAGIEANRGKEL